MVQLGRKFTNYAGIAKDAVKSEALGGVIKGRHLQHDTDFTCYQVAAWLDITIDQAFKNLIKSLEHDRKAAKAEHVNAHITLGLKSGRVEMATVKPYQEQRNTSPELSHRVLQLRTRLATYTGHPTIAVVVNTIQEADDSLRQYQVSRIAEHGIDSSVLQSGDKDLWFTDGKHIKEGVMHTVDGYGTTQYKEVGNAKPKLIGRGTSWFWHQMLMGDTADNIPGLPQVSARLMNEYLPTKKFNPKRKPAQCGEAKAVAILKGVTTEKEALDRVYEAYSDHYGDDAAEMLIEQAYLLWIRRTSKLDDVLTYLNEIGGGWKFSKAQLTRLQGFIKEARVKQEQADAKE